MIKQGKCDYCEQRTEVRGTPILADVPAHICERCWGVSREGGIVAEGMDIGPFHTEEVPSADTLGPTTADRTLSGAALRFAGILELLPIARPQDDAVKSGMVADLKVIAKELHRFETTVPAMLEALKVAKAALTHDVPGSCWATGPNTGNVIEDLVVCPGCRALHSIDKAISKVAERSS